LGYYHFTPTIEAAGNVLVNFNFPITKAFQGAVCRNWILPEIDLSLNEFESVEYKPQSYGVISYGGGIDSLAAHCLLPELKLVHETPLGPEYKDSVNDILADMLVDSRIVKTNLRTLYSTWGLPLWVSVFISSLLEQPKYIISGSELTGTYLMGGQKYHPRYKNLWYTVFSSIGVEVLPTSFLSEIGNSLIVSKSQVVESAAYCTFIDRKRCQKCSKCLRRALLLAATDDKYESLLNDFEYTEDIEKFLQTRPLYYGDIFIAASQKYLKIKRGTYNDVNPQPVINSLSDLLGAHQYLEFHSKYYAETFEHFNYPVDIRDEIIESLAKHEIESMNDLDLVNLRQYVQLPSDAVVPR